MSNRPSRKGYYKKRLTFKALKAARTKVGGDSSVRLNSYTHQCIATCWCYTLNYFDVLFGNVQKENGQTQVPTLTSLKKWSNACVLNVFIFFSLMRLSTTTWPVHRKFFEIGATLTLALVNPGQYVL